MDLRNFVVVSVAIGCCDKPKAGMSRWPFQLMLLAKMKCERVTPGEDLITDVALIFGHPPNLFKFYAMTTKHHFNCRQDYSRLY